MKEHHVMIITIKNHKGKISIEFPESVKLEKSYFTKHLLQSEAILKLTWMRNAVAFPECAGRGTGNELDSGAKFDALFSAGFPKQFSSGVRLESLFSAWRILAFP